MCSTGKNTEPQFASDTLLSKVSLIPGPLPDLSDKHRELIFLHGCKIKLGVA